jgi:hypothetical protein
MYLVLNVSKLTNSIQSYSLITAIVLLAAAMYAAFNIRYLKDSPKYVPTFIITAHAQNTQKQQQ